jgi:hypothetical protein
VYKHDPSISIEIGHGDSSWNVSLLLRAEKTQLFCPGSRDLNWTSKGLSQIGENVENMLRVGCEECIYLMIIATL